MPSFNLIFPPPVHQSDRNTTTTNILSLRVQIVPHRTLQPRRTLAQQTCQVVQIVACRDAKLAHKVFGRGFEIAVVVFRHFVFGSSKVGV
jgi:hypothetical protein